MQKTCRAHHNNWSTHALPEEHQILWFIDETFEFCTIRCTLNFAAAVAFPLLEICGSSKSVIESWHFYVIFTGEKCFEISFKVIHLEEICGEYFRMDKFSKFWICKFEEKFCNKCNSLERRKIPDNSIREFVYFYKFYKKSFKQTYPIYKSNFIKVNPARQQLVPKCCQRTWIAKHEFFSCHVYDGFTLCLSDDQIDGQSQEIRFWCGHLRNALQKKKYKKIY